MARKALRLLIPASVVIVAASGQHSYPAHHGARPPDGTGDFDSPTRGGGPAEP